MATFLVALEPDPNEKGQWLADLLMTLRGGRTRSEAVEVNPQIFRAVPTSPYCYWADAQVISAFDRFPHFEDGDRTVRVGLQTGHDERFIRSWWEIGSAQNRDESWPYCSKGGDFSPFYTDIHLVVKWQHSGEEIKNLLTDSGKQASRPQNEEYYFKSGLTWQYRTHRFSPSALPEGVLPTVRGSLIYPGEENPLDVLFWASSSAVDTLLRVSMGRVGHPQFDMGDISNLPYPGRIHEAKTGREATTEAIDLKRTWIAGDETSPNFLGVHLLDLLGEHSIATADDELEKAIRSDLERLSQLQAQINAEVAAIYFDDPSPVSTGDDVDWPQSKGALLPFSTSTAETTATILQWCVGVAFGRWDIRMAKDETLIPELQGPFERLPQVAPAGLVGPDGLPANQNWIASEAWLRARPNVITLPEPGSVEGPDYITADDYPIEVAWDGVLVDDPGHPRDLIRKVREVLQWVYGPERAREIEDEAVEILRGDGRTPRTLRDWFRNQKATDLGKNFFDFHIARYSKSRRKAPIYWRLCTSPGRGQSDYGIWLYYHRLTDDTLWTVLNQYVGPKLEREEQRLEELRSKRSGASGSETQSLGKEIEALQDLLEELRWFEGELRKVAETGAYAPDLDDGVIINMAPLHAVVPWNEPEKVWKKLKKGEYDWAKLAMRYWPERVREKCADDRSLAIAHGIQQTDAEE